MDSMQFFARPLKSWQWMAVAVEGSSAAADTSAQGAPQQKRVPTALTLQYRCCLDPVHIRLAPLSRHANQLYSTHPTSTCHSK